MNYFVNCFLIFCALIQSVYGVYPNVQNVADFFFRPHLTNKDPAISMKCFSNYIVKSNEVSETYSRNYKECLLDAKGYRQSTEAKEMVKRFAIVNSSRDVCKRLSTCDSLNTTLAIFRCHADIGANNTRDVYNISGNATQYALELQEKYRIIDLQQEQCSNTAERSYVEATGATYRSLQGCLGGRIDHFSSTTTTTTALTTSTTTLRPPTTNRQGIEAPASIDTEAFDTITSEAAELLDTTILPGAEEFAKLSKLLK